MNRFLALSLLIVLCCMASLPGAAQVKKYPSTLLWRITGRGISKPSYLFGTMHVTDRRVFYFGDSLYNSLEKADGYAMEVNPDTAVAALVRSILAKDTSGLVKDAMDNKEFSKMAKRLETELGVPANRITKKQLWLYSFKGGRDKKDDDMDSPVDTYLYNIAKRQGKWVGGIEDIEDQLNLVEELGSKFEADALLYKTDSKTGMEKMTDLYKNQDLDKIEGWIAASDSVSMYNLLGKRNKKMAHRIDSMAALRSMFFAVGAAHLPGTGGLITLLRSMGYTVEPVISSKKIAPEAYTYKEVELPWQTIQDENNSYTVQMPGKAFLMDLPNDLKMQCYADLGTGLIYFVMSVQYPMKVGNTDSVLATMARSISSNGTIEKQASIDYQGTHGLEITAAKINNYHYRMRTFLRDEAMVLVMTGSEKKALLESKEGERFLNSLVMHDKPRAPVAKNAAWQAMNRPEKGYSLEWPGRPERNKQMENLFRKNKAAANWLFESYSYSDINTGNYYIVSVKETAPGYHLVNDTGVFYDTKKSLIANGADVVVYDTLRQQGYTALKMEVLYSKTNLQMRDFIVSRANRVYSIVALAEKGKGDTAGIRRFMQSFRLLEPGRPQWSEQPAPDSSFYAWSPAPFSRVIYDTAAANDAGGSATVGFDSLSSIGYEVERVALDKYYWTDSDSSFFAHQLVKYQAENDSLLQQKEVRNGATMGREYLFREAASNNLRRLRILAHGDTTYLLYAFAPQQMRQDADMERFFNSFRFRQETTGKPYLENKTKQLMSALLAADSAGLDKLQSALRQSPHFHRSDLPLLHEALLHNYADSSSGLLEYSVYGDIMDAVADLKDSSTIAFVAAQYPLLAPGKESLKYPLLAVLAKLKTQASFRLLKQLLLEQTPRGGDADILSSPLVDSMELTATLLPDLLTLSKDTAFIKILPYVLTRLADYKFFDLAALAPYKKDYYAFASRKLKSRQDEDDDYDSEANYLIRVLGSMKEAGSTALLQRFVQCKNIELKNAAALALIKSNRPVNPLQLEKIAADKSMRTDLYDSLAAWKKEKLFPAKYLSQKGFASCELYRMATDEDYDSARTVFIGERQALFMGKQQLFYLYKVTIPNSDDEPHSYLGVTGPYKPGSTRLLGRSDAGSINWEEEYDPTKTAAQLKSLLNNAESRLKTKAE